jgi:hypothetical protein
MARDVRDEAGKSRTTTLTEVNPEVVRKWPHPIGALNSSK